MRVLARYALWCAGLAGPEMQTTDAERACLVRHATDRRRLAEIGVWQGGTTRELRRAMAPDGVLCAVDPYRPGRLRFSAPRRIARGEVARVAKGTVHWVRTTGADAPHDARVRALRPFDFVFIDGDHSYAAARGDWEAWRELVSVGGVVALHDSRSSAARAIDDAGSARVTRELVLADPGFRPIDAVDTVTVVERVG
jgi:predicted O-methyltransferase YrrM